MKFPDKSVVLEDNFRPSSITLNDLQKRIVTFLARFAEITNILVEITKKELAQIALTHEESHWLRRAVEDRIGGSGMGVCVKLKIVLLHDLATCEI